MRDFTRLTDEKLNLRLDGARETARLILAEQERRERERILKAEPANRSVIQYTHSFRGSTDYTYVAYRSGEYWHITGRSMIMSWDQMIRGYPNLAKGEFKLLSPGCTYCT